jgi:hypothetical protein
MDRPTPTTHPSRGDESPGVSRARTRQLRWAFLRSSPSRLDLPDWPITVARRGSSRQTTHELPAGGGAGPVCAPPPSGGGSGRRGGWERDRVARVAAHGRVLNRSRLAEGEVSLGAGLAWPAGPVCGLPDGGFADQPVRGGSDPSVSCTVARYPTARVHHPPSVPENSVPSAYSSPINQISPDDPALSDVLVFTLAVTRSSQVARTSQPSSSRDLTW